MNEEIDYGLAIEDLQKEDILNVTGRILGTMLDYADNSNKELEQLRQENKQLKEKIDKYKNISEKFEHWLRLELEIKCKNEYVVPFKIALEKLLELENGDSNE